ncbi:MAG TPA: dienelactone hydrolase family protein [Flavisolibacter sp.]|nr:dienelactone hydrolase family protein [Flavisolibacter sp.]
MIKSNLLLSLAVSLSILSCNNDSTNDAGKKDSSESTTSSQIVVKEEPITYAADSTTLKGYVAYNENGSSKRPIVLVVPEWWGLTEYPRIRAKLLAEMGYFAVAVDMFGNGKQALNPEEAQKEAMPFYTNPQLAKERLDAALTKAKTFAQADTSQVVAIGYCFGGSMVLNYAKMGGPVTGVVSFHGSLEGVPPQKGTKAQFLICHGAADSFVPQPQVDAFKKSMDSAGVAYTFKTYDNATHAFTNPKATETGTKFNMPIQYDAAADKASWNDMQTFFKKILR